jgi:hypothetical protein
LEKVVSGQWPVASSQWPVASGQWSVNENHFFPKRYLEKDQKLKT